MTNRREFCLSLLGVTAFAAVARADGQPPRIKNYNVKGTSLITEGQTLLVEYQFAAPLRSLNGSLPVPIEPASFGGETLTEPQPLYFYPSPDKRAWRTFLTAPLDVVPGTRQVNLQAVFANGQRAAWASPYLCARGVYRNANLTVSENFSQPSPAIKAQTARDFSETVAALATRAERLWTQPFVLPTKGAYRSNYGDKRTYNRTKHKRHAGIDMTASIGTPIRAMNDGIVALSTAQWAPGQVIILNHGGGVFTKYIHLSQRRVQTGDTVRRGDIIALSGNTGGQKVAPHLHLDLLVNGAAVNPIQFLKVAQQLIDAEAGRPVKV